MPAQADIDGEQQLLQQYRRSLAHLIQQASRYGGEAHVPLSVMHNIADARQHIQRSKANLRAWGVDVEDLPHEEPLGNLATPPAAATSSQGDPAPPPLSRPWLERVQKHPIVVVIVACMAVFGCMAAAISAGADYGAFCQQLNLPCARSQPVNITVRATNPDGRSLPRVAITLLHDGQATTTQPTDAQGIAVFSIRSDAGTGQLVAQADRYEVREDTVDLTESRNVTMMLRPQDANNRSIIVRIVHAVDRTPIANAQVTVIAQGAVYSDLTDGNGLATYAIPFDGATLAADISVNATGKQAATQNVTLQPTQLYEMSLDDAPQDSERTPTSSG
ncbi:MAG: hypothetical protein H7Z42_11490 [Roseiflexaceae bacterium]|nr:hypothetical protein [Roseiflexaceae bacterium]